MDIEYAILEWMWEESSIRVNLPGNEEKLYQGSYLELVEVLNKLGKDGWEVAACVSESNWIFWTLKKVVSPHHGSL